MERLIKYRGKTINEGAWVYSMTIGRGTIDRKKHDLFMEIAPDKWKGIINDTLGQFTGLYDCDGKEIFEGDVVRLSERTGSLTGVISWHPYMCAFYINADGREATINNSYATLGEMWKSYRKTLQVIGNVWDDDFSDGKWLKY